jgi:ABC-2 type transport system permease protein
MARALEIASYALPLTYAYDALERITVNGDVDARVAFDVAVIALATVAALALGAATLRRRTA